MTRSIAAALAVLGVLTALAGCGTADESTGAGPSVGAQADPLPPRPRTIRLDDVDPCALATPAVLDPTGVTSPRPLTGSLQGIHACTASRAVSQRPSGALGISAVTNQDVRNVLSVRGSEVTTVAGFGAVEIPDDAVGAEYSCDLRVDVAPNQGLWVSYLVELGDEAGATHELMCQRAHTAAETIMRDLLARTK